jgi:HTH-type transcriptional regulator / antitoxin HigA
MPTRAVGTAEARANQFAGDHLIPPTDYAGLCARGRPSKAEVVAFADRIGIAPSIVVGRLQRDKVIPGSRLNDVKTKLEWGE